MTLKPGPHTLQLLFGDKDHVPHTPPVMSPRIRVVVAEPQLPELAVVPQVPRAEARSAAVVELPSSPLSSLAVVTRSASGATKPR